MDAIYRLQQPLAVPPPPQRFSYSALKAVETCPRRWWLLHATFPNVDGPGYPQRPAVALIRGTVVHRALQAFAAVLRDADSPAPGSESFELAWQRFDLRGVVQRLRADELERLRSNPRANAVAIGSQLSVTDCVNRFKHLWQQTYLPGGWATHEPYPRSASRQPSDMPLPAHFPGTIPLIDGGAERSGTNSGPKPECTVAIDDPPFVGVIDLALLDATGDVLIEFKTGEPREEYTEQARIYAVLWRRGTGRAVKQYRLIYAEMGYPEQSFGPLTEADCNNELERLRSRVRAAYADLVSQLPVAHLSEETCRWCSVRQLCDDYWESRLTAAARWDASRLPALRSGDRADGWRDLELIVEHAERRADTLVWPLTLPHTGNDGAQPDAVLQATIPAPFRPGALAHATYVRMLGVGLRKAGSTVYIEYTSASEVFWG